jgi:hypothetical protein
MSIRYSFKTPVTFHKHENADPNVIGNELERITLANNGRLTPHAVVDSARNRRSPLHPHFEWSDKIAAEAYRLDQARELVRTIRIEDTENSDTPPRRAFLSINDGGTSYRGLAEVLGSNSLQLRVLQAAERELQAFEHRYQELLDVCSIVRAARTKVQERIVETTQQQDSRPPS